MSLSSVVTAGYLPDAGASLPLVTLFGYSNGADAPPTPPTPDESAPPTYGPALTPGERARWFGGNFPRGRDDDEISPQAYEVRRKAIERLKRIEIGLIPADIEKSIPAKVEAEVPAAVARPMGKAKADTGVAVKRVVERVTAQVKAEVEARKAQEKEFEEEEKEAMLLLSMVMYTLR